MNYMNIQHSPIGGHLGCFQFLAIVYEAAVKFLCASLSVDIGFHFFWVNIGSEIAD